MKVGNGGVWFQNTRWMSGGGKEVRGLKRRKDSP